VKAAKYLSEAHPEEESSKTDLEGKTGMRLEVSLPGSVIILGRQAYMEAARQLVRAFADNVPDRSRGDTNLPAETFDEIVRCIPEIIRHCGGPHDRAGQERIIKL
jgi:hypothetical protein